MSVAKRVARSGLISHPQSNLGEAREARDKARKSLAAGNDPAMEKQRDKRARLVSAENTFDAIAKEYCAKRKRDGDKPWSQVTADKAEWLLGMLSPVIGKMPVTEIKPADLLAAVRPIEKRGHLESAWRALQRAGSVLSYAVATAPGWIPTLHAIYAVPSPSKTVPRS